MYVYKLDHFREKLLFQFIVEGSQFSIMSTHLEEVEFHVCLLSNSSMTTYPSNVLSAFTNHLGKSFKLTGNWCVGLTEIAFSQIKSWDVPITKSVAKRSAKDVSPEKRSDVLNSVKNNFSEILHDALNELEKIDQESNGTLKSTHEAAVSSSKGKDDETVQLSLWQSSLFIPPLLYTISNSLLSIKELMFVYTDIIKPRIIGDMHTRCLRVIPVTLGEQKIRFNHIEYCPIERANIESISIMITNAQGNQVDFKSNIHPTYIMLHFKKILSLSETV